MDWSSDDDSSTSDNTIGERDAESFNGVRQTPHNFTATQTGATQGGAGKFYETGALFGTLTQYTSPYVSNSVVIKTTATQADDSKFRVPSASDARSKGTHLCFNCTYTI